MTVTASKLRQDIYKILDSVIETGEPVAIERKGRVLRIVADPPPGSRLSRMKKRPGLINGDPHDLVEIDWSKEWNPDDNI
ncbi:MAG: type II toxin-antitoxin system Phd/YefM family antitoxin [Bryobacteraceae bacterium]|jgi:antitoxin (DNA-binding transcriptional repressor) of toxin-antitoxin stability system